MHKIHLDPPRDNLTRIIVAMVLLSFLVGYFLAPRAAQQESFFSCVEKEINNDYN